MRSSGFAAEENAVEQTCGELVDYPNDAIVIAAIVVMVILAICAIGGWYDHK